MALYTPICLRSGKPHNAPQASTFLLEGFEATESFSGEIWGIGGIMGHVRGNGALGGKENLGEY